MAPIRGCRTASITKRQGAPPDPIMLARVPIVTQSEKCGSRAYETKMGKPITKLPYGGTNGLRFF